jgi:hypothetical protein
MKLKYLTIIFTGCILMLSGCVKEDSSGYYIELSALDYTAKPEGPFKSKQDCKLARQYIIKNNKHYYKISDCRFYKKFEDLKWR